MGKRYLPWMACAAIALVCAPALASGAADDPPETAALAAHDAGANNWFQDAASDDPSDSTVEIVAGGTVTFSNPGPNLHNVELRDDSPAPTVCNQTKLGNPAPVPLDEDGVLPMPTVNGSFAGWEGYCRFDTPGTYLLVCGLHKPGMIATVVVKEPTPTATPSSSATPDPTTTPDPQPTTVPTTVPTPAPTASPTPTATPTPLKAAPKVKSATFKRSTRTLTVAGTTTASGKVKVKLTYKSGKATRTKTFSIKIKKGKFSGKYKLSAGDAKKAAKLSVSVSYTGSKAAKKTVSVKK